MVSDKNWLYRVFPAIITAILILSSPVLSRSEGQSVKAGDEAAVHFTCRLKNGEIAASSYQSVTDDLSLRKSALLLRRTVNTPLAITAGKPYRTPGPGEERSMEGEILAQLSGVIVGMRTGEKQTREIRAERRPEQKKDEYFLKMALVRERAKEMRFTPEGYKSRTTRTPEVGQSFIMDPAVPGTVASVTEKEVVVRFSAKDGSRVATPFGEGIVKELPDRYEITIGAHPGALVRSGGLAGRIVSVDDRFISIDYGHPFGGEPLSCDILVESVKAAAK
jgi:FKBP-type peptidyl-prolyl cis-trans isomerase 2